MNNDDSTVEDANMKVYNDTDRQWTNLDQNRWAKQLGKETLPIIGIDRYDRWKKQNMKTNIFLAMHICLEAKKGHECSTK